MLRKRTRSHQKDQKMGQLNSDVVVSESFVQSDFLAQKHKNNSFFNVPGLFVGFNSKNSESDSVRSPTSPLDFRVFSTWGNPFRSPRSPRLSHEGHHQKTWDTNKVGLSIVDSLDNDAKPSGKVLRASDSKNILFGPQMRIKPNFRNGMDCSDQAPKSLPEGVGIFLFANSKPSNIQKGSSVLFEIGDAQLEPESIGNLGPCSLDSGRSGLHLSRLASRNSNLSSRISSSGSGKDLVASPSHLMMGSMLGDSSGAERSSITATIASGLIGNLSPSEIELSEDYTCVRKHGPNPKVTHIFGDCILECHDSELSNFGSELSNFGKNKEEGDALPLTAECLEVQTSYPSSDFLSFCHYCKKKLDGEDIYMYRGEKAFCSWACREILIDEEMEKCNNNDSDESAEPSNSEELSESGLSVSLEIL